MVSGAFGMVPVCVCVCVCEDNTSSSGHSVCGQSITDIFDVGYRA